METDCVQNVNYLGLQVVVNGEEEERGTRVLNHHHCTAQVFGCRRNVDMTIDEDMTCPQSHLLSEDWHSTSCASETSSIDWESAPILLPIVNDLLEHTPHSEIMPILSPIMLRYSARRHDLCEACIGVSDVDDNCDTCRVVSDVEDNCDVCTAVSDVDDNFDECTVDSVNEDTLSFVTDCSEPMLSGN